MKMASESPVKSQGEPSLQVSVDSKREPTKEDPCRKLQQPPSKASSSSPSSSSKHRPKPYDRSPSASACSTCTSSDESNSEGDVDGSTVHHRRQKRIAANSRERKRMHTVNSAFDQLRELVPTYPSNRKLSKIDTLRLACTYINDLTALVRNPANMQHAGEDVKLFHEAYMQTGTAPGGGNPAAPPVGMVYPGGLQVQVKTEYGAVEYAGGCGGYPHYGRMQHSFMGGSDCASSDYSENCASEAENPSPPYFSQGACAASIAARPPPLTRTNSDSAALPRSNYTHVVPVYHTVPLPPNCSPLVTVQHSLQPNHGLMSPSAQSIPPPVWQRASSVPYCLYGQ